MKTLRIKRKWTLRTAVVAALVVSALPAGAAVLVQNFMRADTTRNAACVTKIAGLDNLPSVITTNVTGTTASSTGVALLNEALSIKSFAGDRTVATDSIRVKNTCAAAVNVFLKAEPGLATTTTSGAWTGLAMNVYLGKSAVVSAGPLTAAASLTDFSVATEWDAAPIRITASATGTVANATTGTVSIPAGQEVQIGLFADSASTAPTTGTATLNFTVVTA